MPVSRPSALPVWATAGGAVVEPSSGKKTDGWLNNERPPAKFWNWIENLQYLWLQWLDQQEQASTAGLAAEVIARTTTDSNVSTLTTVTKSKQDFVQATTPRDKISFGSACSAIATGGSLVDPAHVVVGVSGNWSVSRDLGRSWSAPAAAGAANFLAVSYYANIQTFVAVGVSGTIYESNTAVSSWTARTAAGSFSGNFNDVTYLPAGGLMVAVGENGTTPTIQTSPSPSWSAQTVPSGTTALARVRYDTASSQLVAVGAAGSDGRVIRSADGFTWTTKATITGAGKLIDVVWHAPTSKWYACSASQIYSSPDLITWTSLGFSLATNDLFCGLASLEQDIVAFKYNGSATGRYSTCFISPDGTHWFHHPGFGGPGGNTRPQKIYLANPLQWTDASKSYALYMSNILDSSFSISQWKSVNGLL